jgi:hypothetical protein
VAAADGGQRPAITELGRDRVEPSQKGDPAYTPIPSAAAWPLARLGLRWLAIAAPAWQKYML